jgi:type I restriction-modification system DNA methylase subunit
MNAIVQKLWNYCNVLRDNGVSYGDYVEQLTYLLFLKMADERTRQLLLRCPTFRHPWRSQAPYNQKNPVPEKYSLTRARTIPGPRPAAALRAPSFDPVKIVSTWPSCGG